MNTVLSLNVLPNIAHTPERTPDHRSSIRTVIPHIGPLLPPIASHLKVICGVQAFAPTPVQTFFPAPEQ
jgi:hypothetical protein